MEGLVWSLLPRVMSFKVLSIDGGGVRGLIPATVIAEWETRFNKRSCEYFDLIVGTSTGSIVAGALAVGIPAVEIKEMYLKHGPEIFKCFLTPKAAIPRTFRRSLWPPYDPERFLKIVTDVVGEKVIDDCLTRLCVCCIDLVTGLPRVFKTNHLPEFYRDHTLKLSDAIMASCSAPTYFSSHEFDDTVYVDGGLWANNPSLVGALEARRATGVDGFQSISLLSVGCGQPKWHRSPNFGRKAWGIAWLFPVIDLTLRVQAISVQNYCAYAIPAQNYLRIDVELPRSLSALDSFWKLKELLPHARTVAMDNATEIEARFGATKITPYVRSREVIDKNPLIEADGVE